MNLAVGGHPRTSQRQEQCKTGDKKSAVLIINGDMLVMGHDRAERKGKSEKTLRKTAAGIPESNMHNRFIQQGDRKGDFFFLRVSIQLKLPQMGPGLRENGYFKWQFIPLIK